jgi:tRNA dimethylallyltransferase
MVSRSSYPPLVVILGETASGKSALAIDLALKFNGEIIAADSRTIYKGMDIGTAKPDIVEQKLVCHHLLDIYSPDHPINVSNFQQLANLAINDVISRGKLPLLVGGSGLYIDSVIFEYSFSGESNKVKRVELQQLSVEELQDELKRLKITLPANYKNPRHLMRQLETGGIKQDNIIRPNVLLIGIKTERSELKNHVEHRVESMFRKGLAKEATDLLNKYGSECSVLNTIGYKEFKGYISGELTIDSVRRNIIMNTLSYAKRQRTWFRRNKSIHWICKRDEAVDLISTFLNKVSVV